MKKFGLLVLTILIALSSQAQAASITVPTINVAPVSYYPLDEMLYIEGYTAPGKDVELLFDGSNSALIRTAVHANSNGEWFFGERLELAGGDWMVRARTLDGNGSSDWSNPRIIRSIISGFVLGSIKIKYLPIAIILLSLFIVGLAFLIYALMRARNIRYAERAMEITKKAEDLRRQLRDSELRSANTLIEKSFADLRADLLEELEYIERRSKDGILTKEEEKHRENMLRELRQIEEEIERQVRNIV